VSDSLATESESASSESEAVAASDEDEEEEEEEELDSVDEVSATPCLFFFLFFFFFFFLFCPSCVGSGCFLHTAATLGGFSVGAVIVAASLTETSGACWAPLTLSEGSTSCLVSPPSVDGSAIWRERGKLQCGEVENEKLGRELEIESEEMLNKLHSRERKRAEER
jgi:hypothetical protein